MSTVTLAATQIACSWDLDQNIQKAETAVRAAASSGSSVVYFARPSIVNTFTKCALNPKHTTF